jgi:uncharacterized membrane protein YdfJ with MMPL/SSD domain
MVALPALGSEVNSDPSLFLSGGARSVEAADLGTSLLGARTASKVTIVAATSGARLTGADVAAIQREARLAQQVTGVQSVRYVAESPGGDAVQLTATVNRDTSDVAGLKPVIAALQATFPRAAPPPGLQLHLAGQAATNAANNASGNKATNRIGLLSVVLIIVLLLMGAALLEGPSDQALCQAAGRVAVWSSAVACLVRAAGVFASFLEPAAV